MFEQIENPDIEYVNRFHEAGDNLINGPVYFTKFSHDSATVYIINILYYRPDYIHGGLSADDPMQEYEVFIKDASDEFIPLCNTSFVHQELADQIDSLYMLITDTQVGIRVTPEVRHIIDNYFNEKDAMPFPQEGGCQ